MAGKLLIAGTTISGIFAAMAARAKGVSQVYLFTDDAWIGGLHTGGIMLTDFGEKNLNWGYWAQLNQIVANYYASATSVPSPAPLAYAWRFEPYKMMEALLSLINGDAGIIFVYNAPITKVIKSGNKATGVIAGGQLYEGDAFLDCSYEGDLMHLAGVSNTYGREGKFIFNEPAGGVAYGDRVVRPYPVVDAKGNRYDNISPNFDNADGQGDSRIQGFNFRTIWSNKADRLPWQAPPGYRSDDFLDVQHEIQTRNLKNLFTQDGGGTSSDWWFKKEIDGDPALGKTADLRRPQAAGKFGINQKDQYELCWEWPYASPARRKEIKAYIYYRQAGTLYFIANDPAFAGTDIQASARAYGLCPDEYQGVGNYYGQPGWSPVLYIRECRRLVGQYIMTQADFAQRGHVPDSICVSDYYPDGHTKGFHADGDGKTSYKEGHSGATGSSAYKRTSIPFRAIKPVKGQCDNLLCVVPHSTTSIMWQPNRMEPTWAMMGQAAGWAAAYGINNNIPLVDVPYSAIQPDLIANGAFI